MARGSVREFDRVRGFRIGLGPDQSIRRCRQVSKRGFRTEKEAARALWDPTLERLGLIGRNPVVAARPPVSMRVEQRTWSSVELREFQWVVRADRLYGAYALLVTTRVRRREVLGLRWRDVDFAGAELSVSNTLTTAGRRTSRCDKWAAPGVPVTNWRNHG